MSKMPDTYVMLGAKVEMPCFYSEHSGWVVPKLQSTTLEAISKEMFAGNLDNIVQNGDINRAALQSTGLPEDYDEDVGTFFIGVVLARIDNYHGVRPFDSPDSYRPQVYEKLRSVGVPVHSIDDIQTALVMEFGDTTLDQEWVDSSKQTG